jgi:putative ABC transport system permease protein
MSAFSRLLSLLHTERMNHEIDEEQEFHINCRVSELVSDGMPPDEAARQARLEFGSRTRARAESHDARLFSWIESTVQDLFYGVRSLRKAPVFAIVAIVTLALGIGANTAIFSVVNGVLFNPLPYPQPDRIVCLFEKIPNFDNGSISYPNFVDWQRMNRTFSLLAAYRPQSFDLMGQGEPEQLRGQMVSAGFFEILGVRPVLGRTFKAANDKLGAAPTAMISEALWRRKFGSAPDIVGRRLDVDGIGRTVIGVVPSSFHLRIQNFGSDSSPDVYTPVGEYNEPRFYSDRGAAWGLVAIGRLKPGVTFDEAREDMERVSRQLSASYPDFDTNKTARLVPLKEQMVGDTRPLLLILLGAVSFVLLICCANVANLLLARSSARQREFAIRVAVGAGHTRIVRQLLTESVLLALIGGALGLLLAQFGTTAAIKAMPQSLPRAEEIGLDLRVLLFTLCISLAAGLIFGLAPAWKMRRDSTAIALRESGRSIAGGRSRAQKIFVITEIALALVLLIGAGLMIRTLFALWGADPGFNPRAVISFFVSAPPSLPKEPAAAIRAWLRQVHDSLAEAPGVESVSLNFGASLMQGDSDGNFWFAGRPRPAHPTDMPMALFYVTEPAYFKTLQISLERGRLFTDADNEHSAPVALIDETLAQKYFPREDPIGQRLILDTDPAQSNRRPNAQIIGVVRHVNEWGLGVDRSHLQAQIYWPAMQIPDSELAEYAPRFGVYVRGKNGRVPSFDMLRARLQSLSSELVAFDANPMQYIVMQSVADKRFTMSLLAVFAGLALLLASIGIYGVLSYLTGQRTQEIGVRMALGAARLDVLRLILRDGARMVATGAVIGLAASLGLTQLMSNMLFGVKPTDLPTFSLVIAALSSVALLACYIPARRAMNIDPAIALREE